MRPWENYIRDVVPYVPGEQPQGEGIIKLNTNENPYPPAPGVIKALKEMDGEQFRKYPDPSSNMLVEELARIHGLKKEQIFVGVGSDDVLGMAFLTFFNSPKPILFPDVTYSFYPVWAKLFGIPYEMVPVDERFQIRTEDYRGRENGGIIFPNPNAPTGIALAVGQVERIAEANPDVVVIVDEAYIDFGGHSARFLIDRLDNLLVVRTFSKSRSMAGMRIGYAMGSEKLISALQNVKYSYNSYTMNMPSIILGTEALKDQAYFDRTVAKIVRTRERTAIRLRDLGFSFTQSSANFLFVTHERVPAKELFRALREVGIYVRYFPEPRLKNHLRVTIGTDEEMEELVRFLESYLKKI